MTERKCACNKLFSILVNLAGVGRRNKFCENIISVPLPNLSWIYLHLNPLLLVYESIMKAL
ncbi:hypothetical protein DDL28_02410 [Staphylococcus aureus]|uniref:Nitrogen fixation protein NifR n=1 Tax=Staphylococcus aureus TaxID=1280 RepID=A0AAX2YV23_STAAU|nr:hypothetical protein RK67_004380 [Staphylococcus aureus]EFG44348.1 conserved hypothetical protein [Staphylococcus aureus A8819]EFH36511.1 conserved hypothetical protein [Staphylococcus aureus A8796]KAA2225802.1 hypothetical protein F1583_01840 [Staphylococcus sp. 53017]KAA2234493.1 hypothetical protein F1590_00455 [Staphylococcus sp. 52717]KAA2249234.1 hypothetical protein F1584_03905 [Staphylococcus sp. 52716]KAA2251730.1 hypothetical protein F1586_01450 [Staphylococcus sp. 6416]KAA22574